MNAVMTRSCSEAQTLLEASALTAGMQVRTRGQHLVLGRTETGPDGEVVVEDRVRLTRLGDGQWGLSVKRHTGRWERTPFSGSMAEMHEAICTFMQHLVAP